MSDHLAGHQNIGWSSMVGHQNILTIFFKMCIYVIAFIERMLLCQTNLKHLENSFL